MDDGNDELSSVEQTVGNEFGSTEGDWSGGVLDTPASASLSVLQRLHIKRSRYCGGVDVCSIGDLPTPIPPRYAASPAQTRQ